VAVLVDRLDAGLDVLDLGCGEGVAIRMMAQRFPRSRFVAEAGFTSVEVSRVEGDPLNAYYVCRP
jgi:trans-aconitate methyltransferase